MVRKLGRYFGKYMDGIGTFKGMDKNHFHFYNLGGVQGLNFSSTRTIDPAFSNLGVNSITSGFYANKALDSGRTNLFDKGQVTVLFTKINIQSGPIKSAISMDFAPGGISDWAFSRLIISSKFEQVSGRVGTRARGFIGRTWADKKGIPSQERFTVEGAGSGDMYRYSFLRDESSFYGDSSLRYRYHLAGDGNLRSFSNQGFVGVEQISSITIEPFFNQYISKLKLELAGFLDFGTLTGSKFNQGDRGFSSPLLISYGFGIRLSQTIYGQPLYLRIDKPLSATVNGITIENMNNWIFSFQKSI